MAPRKVTFFKAGGGGLGVARRTTLLPDDGGPTLAAIQRLHCASANAKAPQSPGAYILIQSDSRCHTQMCAPLIRFSARADCDGVEPRAGYDPEQEDEDKCE
jgi:hypothetical protein